MSCKWGKKYNSQKNSSAWRGEYRIPLSVVAWVREVNYNKMELNECLCIPEMCRCYEEKGESDEK
jgi:hypothetical protein